MPSDERRLRMLPDTPPGVGRRDALQILLGSAAGLAIPGVASGHALHDHVRDPSRIAQADTRAAAQDRPLAFLGRHEFDTLRALAERIVPGAARARTAEFIDELLAVDTEAHQRSFLNALGAFEGRARAAADRPWTALTDAAQDAILTEASSQAPGVPPEPPWTPGQPILPPPPATANQPLTLRDHFDLLKDWIAGAYYSSEIGMRELGWTGRVAFDRFPGCEHPEGHP